MIGIVLGFARLLDNLCFFKSSLMNYKEGERSRIVVDLGWNVPWDSMIVQLGR